MKLKVDGLDAAIIGFAYRCGQPEVLVYDTNLVIEVLMERDGLSYEDASEWMEFNIVGGLHGEETPIWLYPYQEEMLDEEESDGSGT